MGQQGGQAEGDEPGVLAPAALLPRPAVLRDGTGQEVERLADRLARDPGGAEDRQHLSANDSGAKKRTTFHQCASFRMRRGGLRLVLPCGTPGRSTRR